MNATTTRTAQAAAKTDLHKCECSRFIVILSDGTEVGSVCTAKTKRTFAPGHDAKLKGVLIRAAVAGNEVVRIGEGTNTYTDALSWARSFGFGHMVEAGVELAKEKTAKKIANKAARAAKAEAKPVVVEVPATVKVKAKVGRWVYEGEVSDDHLIYTDKQGNPKGTDKFTIVETL